MRTVFAVLLVSFFATNAFACGKDQKGVWFSLVGQKGTVTREICLPSSTKLIDLQVGVEDPESDFNGCRVSIYGSFRRAVFALNCRHLSKARHAQMGERGIYAVFDPYTRIGWRMDPRSIQARQILAKKAGNKADAKKQEKLLTILIWTKKKME